MPLKPFDPLSHPQTGQMIAPQSAGRRSMRPFLRLPALGRFVSSSYLELLTVDYQPLAATGISRFASANTVNSTCTRPIRISPALSELYPFVFFSLWVRSNK